MHGLRACSCRGASLTMLRSRGVRPSHLLEKEKKGPGILPRSSGPEQEGGGKGEDLAGRISSQAAQHGDPQINFLSRVQLDTALETVPIKASPPVSYHVTHSSQPLSLNYRSLSSCLSFFPLEMVRTWVRMKLVYPR